MKIEVPENSVVFLIGPAGCGKSTFAARHFRAPEVLSFEQLRVLVGGDEGDTAALNQTWAALRQILALRLEAGRLTVLDADLTDAATREPLLALCRQRSAPAVAVVFALPEAVCQAWNAARGTGAAGPLHIAAQARAMAAAMGTFRREGFRQLYELRSEQDVAAAEPERLLSWTDRRHDHGPFDLIGSVHGHYDELMALLMELGYRIDFRPAEASVDGYALRHAIHHPQGRKPVFLGDLTDHGPRTGEALRLVMDAVGSGAAVAVRGNHDARLLLWLRDPAAVALTDGLAETAEQLGAATPGFRAQVLAFLESLGHHCVLDDGALVAAHAGLPEALHGHGSAAARAFAIHGEHPGEAEQDADAGSPRWAREYRGNARVVYSHPAVSEPAWLNGTINVGTGCSGSGSRLTALRYPELTDASVAIRTRR